MQCVPTADIPTGGIFITRRMEAARQNGVEIVPVNIYVEDVGLLKWLKKRIFHMPLQSIPLKQQLSIKYTNVGVPYTVFDAICWMLDGKVGQKVVTRKFRKSILNEVECDIIHAHWFWPYARRNCILDQSNKRDSVLYYLPWKVK